MNGRHLRVNVADRLFQSVLYIFSLFVIALAGILLYELGKGSWISVARFGLGFLTGSTWDPVHRVFGALSFLFGTFVTAGIGVLVGIVIGVGAAVLLSQYDWPWLIRPLGMLLDLLAAIPSVVYGLWGIFVLIPWLRDFMEPVLAKTLGWLPLFRGIPYGFGILSAGLILALMVLPTIVRTVRNVMQLVPSELREGALALGATKEEMIGLVVLPFARTGILGAAVLGLSRAIGETIAIAMVIGNRPEIVWSLFSPGETLTGLLANEFATANSRLYISALYEIALLLSLVSIASSVAARLLVWRESAQRRATP